jgi:LysM repeat protein
MTIMKNKLSLAIGIFLAGFLFLGMTFSALAAPSAQVSQYSTPTPGPDGRIIYIVKPGDTCTSISLLNGVSQDYLRQTNHLDENCTLIEGSQLVLGIGGPAASSPTPGPSPTPLPILPTATPATSGAAKVCVALFNDLNGDGKRQANTDALDNYLADGTEPIVLGGAISLSGLANPYSQTLDTVAGFDPVCFPDVPAGKYTVSAAVPDGFNPTTVLTYQLEVAPGDSVYINFGAQIKIETTPPVEKKTSPLLGILGALILLAGVGLGFFAWRVRKS